MRLHRRLIESLFWEWFRWRPSLLTWPWKTIWTNVFLRGGQHGHPLFTLDCPRFAAFLEESRTSTGIWTLPLHAQSFRIGNVFRVRQAHWGDLGSPGVPGTVSGCQACAQGKRNWCPHADEHSMFFSDIKKNVYLTAWGLGCCMGELCRNTWELRCIMWDLLLQRLDSHSLVEFAPQHVWS